MAVYLSSPFTQIMTLVTNNYCQLQRNNRVLLMLVSPNQWDILQITTSKTSLQEFKMPLYSGLYSLQKVHSGEDMRHKV